MATRDERKQTDKFTPITNIWNILLEHCRSLFKPGIYLAIDEQLVGFRWCCPFRMYMLSKPNKYGIKIIMMCDNSTKYMVDARLYLGKGSVPRKRSAAEFFVGELVTSIEKSKRNIPWTTGSPVSHKRNKPEFPPELSNKKYQNCKACSSIFLLF